MKLLLDLDGVCVDFISAICKLHGKPYLYDDPKFLGRYDTEAAWGITNEELLKPTNSLDWWEMLEPMYDLQSTIELILKYFKPKDVCILSKPPSCSPAAMEGKWYWCDHHLPMFKNKLFGNTKAFCAHREAVLLDDDDFKIDKFRMEGGRGALFPRPWNSMFNHSGELDIVEANFEAMFLQPVSNYS
jgi:hypothetical protein